MALMIHISRLNDIRARKMPHSKAGFIIFVFLLKFVSKM